MLYKKAQVKEKSELTPFFSKEKSELTPVS